MNRLPQSISARTSWTSALAAAVCLTLSACGGGGIDESASPQDVSGEARETAQAVATSNTLHVGIKVPGFPHAVDVYRPAGATRAMVFLHGHGGRSWLSAYDLGINKVQMPAVAKNVNWDWLSRNGIIAIFPQAQNMPGTTTPVWSDYINTSGADDVGFLKALSSYAKSQYGATQVSLGGHSNGGAMTGRIWCEASASFRAYVTLSSAMVTSTYPVPGPTCKPATPAPYLAVVGSADSMLAIWDIGVLPPTPQQIAVGLTNGILVYEWGRDRDRSSMLCGETVSLESVSTTAKGPTWNACNSRTRYIVVNNADHSVKSLETNAGYKMADLIASFIR